MGELKSNDERARPERKARSARPRVFAIAAHPDDIEFMMAGTFRLLGEAGADLHYLNLSSGNCGSAALSAAETRRIRRRESKAAAAILGARHHPSLTDDLEIFYEPRLLKKLAAIVRQVEPEIILTHSPQDYMEDHTNTSRLAVTAAFARGMPNYRTVPESKPTGQSLCLYHAMPYGLLDPLRVPIQPEFFVDIESVMDVKTNALAAHASQREWLDVSQGTGSYLESMRRMSAAVGAMAGTFRFAEGWRRHLHLGFGEESDHPVFDMLGGERCRLNPDYPGQTGARRS